LIPRIILPITAVSLIFYLYYVRIFYLGLRNRDKNSGNLRKKTVSVVVAARNEEKNIARLLTVLLNQDYPPEMFEIIIADDDSQDETKQIVKRFSEKWENIKLVEVKDREKAISPKKNALGQAIAIAKGEIIVTTDADCLVGKNWLKAMTSAFDEKTVMVAGFSQTNVRNWKTEKAVRKFEHFDFLVLFFAAAGAISKGKYFSCSGQNLAYRRDAFEKVGGFEQIKHLVSGDDVNLMQLMRKLKRKIKFCYSPHGFAITKPIDSWRDFFNQRSRWASNSKWQLFLNPEFFVYLFFVFSATVLPFFLLFFAWKWAFLFIAVKFVSDYYFIRFAFGVFEIERVKLRFYPVWFFLQPLYIITVTILGIFSVFRWKK